MPEQKPRPIAVDLYCGVGGLSLGLEQAGFDVLVGVESNERDANAHRFNFPNCTVIQRDIRNVDRAAILQVIANTRGDASWDRPIDLVCGGPPCQGFSHGGRRDIKDERNLMLFEFARIVEEIRPRYFLLENVPGLLHKRYSAILDRFKTRLQDSGYLIEDPLRLNAKGFGVPQDRERVFFVGRRPEERRIRKPHVLSAVTVEEAFDGLRAGGLSSARTDSERKMRQRYARALNSPGVGLAYPRKWDRGEIRDLVETHHSASVRERFAVVAPGTSDQISRFFRLAWGGVSCTLRAGTGPDRGSHTAPRPIHPADPRVVTVREAARLHSFPDWFGFSATKWHAWRQIGNSVPPNLARTVGKSIVKALGYSVLRPTARVALGPLSLIGGEEGRCQTSASRKTG